MELRSVNNRFFKLALKAPESVQPFELEIEKHLREKLSRGTVNVNIRVDKTANPDDYRINTTALSAYLKQLAAFSKEHNIPLNLGDVLGLPGVVDETETRTGLQTEEGELVFQTLAEATTNLQKMRQQEGSAMMESLLSLNNELETYSNSVGQKAPNAVKNYRDKLNERLRSLLADQGQTPDEAAIVREVALFAERTDFHEEIVRLQNHIEQFRKIMKEPNSPGKKLDFLIQEMVREINTTGSKANDVSIAHHVVDMKGIVEKMRELVQNVE